MRDDRNVDVEIRLGPKLDETQNTSILTYHSWLAREKNDKAANTQEFFLLTAN